MFQGTEAMSLSSLHSVCVYHKYMFTALCFTATIRQHKVRTPEGRTVGGQPGEVQSDRCSVCSPIRMSMLRLGPELNQIGLNRCLIAGVVYVGKLPRQCSAITFRSSTTPAIFQLPGISRLLCARMYSTCHVNQCFVLRAVAVDRCCDLSITCVTLRGYSRTITINLHKN